MEAIWPRRHGHERVKILYLNVNAIVVHELILHFTCLVYNAKVKEGLLFSSAEAPSLFALSRPSNFASGCSFADILVQNKEHLTFVHKRDQDVFWQARGDSANASSWILNVLGLGGFDYLGRQKQNRLWLCCKTEKHWSFWCWHIMLA